MSDKIMKILIIIFVVGAIIWGWWFGSGGWKINEDKLLYHQENRRWIRLKLLIREQTIIL